MSRICSESRSSDGKVLGMCHLPSGGVSTGYVPQGHYQKFFILFLFTPTNVSLLGLCEKMNEGW